MILTYYGLLPDDLLQNEHHNCSFDLSSLMSIDQLERNILYF